MALIDMELQSSLTSTEARRRLGVFGPNSLPSAKPPTVWDRLLRLAREPMLILLLLAAAIYFVLGSMAAGIMLMLFALFSISLMFIQERRSEDALAAPKQMAAPIARVRHDGVARVTETGPRTETGKLGASLATIVPEETHLQRTIGQLVRVFGILALFVCGGLAGSTMGW